MAVRNGSAGNGLKRTAALPSAILVTACGWAYQSAAQADATLFSISDAPGNGNYLQTDSSGRLLISSNLASGAFFAAPGVGQWFGWAMAIDATTITAYCLPYGSSVLSTGTRVSQNATVSQMWLLSDPFDEWFSGRMANIKIWDATLTQAEILAELRSVFPVRRANLHGHYPMHYGSKRAVDFSGQNHDLTEVGTLTNEVGPSLPLALPDWYSMLEVAKSASGATYSLSMAQGSFTLTGESAGLRVSHTLIAAQGSLALTGEPAAFKLGHTLPAVNGNYALTGESAAFRQALHLALSQGSYSLTGEAASFEVGHVLAAGQGAFVLTGKAAGFRVSHVLTLAQGAYVLTGESAAFIKALHLALANGSYALTGEPAGFPIGRVIALAHGSYALSGQSAGLLHGRKLALAQGSYTLTGEDANFSSSSAAHYSLAAGQGAYALTGEAVIFSAAYHLPLVRGSYTLVGETAGLSVGRRLAGQEGSFVMSGQSAGFPIARKIALGQGVLVLSGQLAGFKVGRQLSLQQGQFVLTGEPAALVRSVHMVANHGVYVLTGWDVGFSSDGDVVVVYFPLSVEMVRVIRAQVEVHRLVAFETEVLSNIEG